jgi:hypothetical protein
MSEDEALWNIFVAGRPDLEGSRHDDPDPEDKVWPAFLRWRFEFWRNKLFEEEGTEEALPVTRRLLRGGVE